jgi:hypothetical protein
VALAVPYVVVNNAVTVATNLFTVPSSGTVGSTPYYPYARDLVVTNSGTANAFVALNATSAAATTTASFVIPSGGSIILTQCQVPVGTIVSAIPVASGTASVSVGFGTNVSYI